MNILLGVVLFVCVFVANAAIESHNRTVIVGIDQREVCIIKQSCVECLRLAHCSWCKKDKKCFSNELSPELCKNDTNEYIDFGFSLEENAVCACSELADIEQDCHPLEVDSTTEPPCSGRGRCVCGRCVCDTHENSTKMVMGDYCEYDNFSCDGPRCNEGPYLLNQPMMDP